MSDPTKRRDAQIIDPSTLLKSKVGSGGLSDHVLQRAQSMLDNASTDFKPLAENFLDSIGETHAQAQSDLKAGQLSDGNHETLINTLIYPSLELKSHGAMFQYPAVSRIATNLVKFLEVIKSLDEEALEIVEAYHQGITLIVSGRIPKEGRIEGEKLYDALNAACTRYFDKHKS